MTAWLRKNIPLVLSIITLLSITLSFAANIIPMPAKASDLDKHIQKTQENFDNMTNAVQKLAEVQAAATLSSEIRTKQAEIRAIKRDYSRQGESISQDSQITIEELEDEIGELRWQRENQN